MIYLFNLVIVLLFFVLMEFVAWFSHKYLMHGALWFLHADHHKQPKGFFQKNDSFFLIFATPGATFIILGIFQSFNWLFYAGIGVLLYGIAYFFVHEVIIHKRYSKLRKLLFPSFENSNYIKNLIKAHHIHHKVLTKDGAESFGMLWVPSKIFLKEK